MIDARTAGVGLELPPLVKGPITRDDLKAYAAASGDPNPMHLDDIRSGRFAAEWTAEQQNGLQLFNQMKEMARFHPLFEWEQRTRKAFRMDD